MNPSVPPNPFVPDGKKFRVVKTYMIISAGYRSGSAHLNIRTSSSDAIRRWFSQWHVKGNVENKSPIGRAQSVHTPDNIARRNLKDEKYMKEQEIVDEIKLRTPADN
ncbi:hypothetical protein C0J52_21865 [Blattella germanica]|nr:hypothetical protein C0J52_21865 [Blattella germanica]